MATRRDLIAAHTRRYTRRGAVAHLTQPSYMYSPADVALCGMVAIYGTGSQDEYDRASALPLCSRCSELATPGMPADEVA